MMAAGGDRSEPSDQQSKFPTCGGAAGCSRQPDGSGTVSGFRHRGNWSVGWLAAWRTARAPNAINNGVTIDNQGFVMAKSNLQRTASPNGPEEFLRLVGPGKHIALFYESPDRARRVEFAFLEAGLRKGEAALYASSRDEPADVLGAMKIFGISADRYVKSGKLRVRKVPDPALDPEGPLHGLEEFLRETGGPLTGSFRQVMRLFDLNTEKEVKNVIEIERMVGTSVEGTQNSFVCSFHMDKEQHPSCEVWFTEMIKDHHGAVFVPASSEGIGFYFK